MPEPLLTPTFSEWDSGKFSSTFPLPPRASTNQSLPVMTAVAAAATYSEALLLAKLVVWLESASVPCSTSIVPPLMLKVVLLIAQVPVPVFWKMPPPVIVRLPDCETVPLP